MSETINNSYKLLIHTLRLFIIISTIVFVVFSILPSDPIRNIVGINASEEAVKALKHEFGYDRPIIVRYVEFITAIFHWDFGISLVTRKPVGSEFLSAYKLTLSYVGIALLIGVIFSLTLFLIGASGSAFIKKLILYTSIAVNSMPSIVISVTAGIIIIRSGLFIRSDYQGFLLAVTSLCIYPTFSLAEISLRAITIQSTSSSVIAAKAVGYTKFNLFLFCLLRPALLPWIGHLSNIAASLVAGSVIIEAVFSLPGIGRLLVQSVLQGDLPMIQGIVMVSVFGFVIFDLFAKAFSRLIVGRVYR